MVLILNSFLLLILCAPFLESACTCNGFVTERGQGECKTTYKVVQKVLWVDFVWTNFGKISQKLFREPPSVLWRRGNARINWGQSISIQVIIIVIIFVVGVIVLIIIIIRTCIALQENLVGRFLSLRAQTLSFDLALLSPARLASFRSRKMQDVIM